MYIPKAFAESDSATLYQFMRENNFAVLVTHQAGQMVATHLPVMVDAEQGLLKAHMARANEQWQHFDSSEVLLIFQGPHAYISPTWYQTQPSVPTWNYAAVHVYGVPRLVEDGAAVRHMLRELVQTHERGREREWTMDLPEDYLQKMMQAIVAFEIPIERIEGKFKLSQNRSDADQASVIAALSGSSSPLETETAHLMTSRRAGTT
jgi:transcriptional regulator